MKLIGLQMFHRIRRGKKNVLSYHYLYNRSGNFRLVVILVTVLEVKSYIQGCLHCSGTWHHVPEDWRPELRCCKNIQESQH